MFVRSPVGPVAKLLVQLLAVGVVELHALSPFPAPNSLQRSSSTAGGSMKKSLERPETLDEVSFIQLGLHGDAPLATGVQADDVAPLEAIQPHHGP